MRSVSRAARLLEHPHRAGAQCGCSSSQHSYSSEAYAEGKSVLNWSVRCRARLEPRSQREWQMAISRNRGAAGRRFVAQSSNDCTSWPSIFGGSL